MSVSGPGKEQLISFQFVSCLQEMSRLGAEFGKKANVCFVFPDKELGLVLPRPLGATLAALLLPEQPRCVCYF